jgi:hypothetical protein
MLNAGSSLWPGPKQVVVLAHSSSSRKNTKLRPGPKQAVLMLTHMEQHMWYMDSVQQEIFNQF